MIKVLVVEDEKVVAWDIQRDLQRTGYTVVAIVSSAEAALHAADQHRPDLVLMDIHLAGPEDGISAAQSIAVCCNIPVIFLTAYVDESTVQRAAATSPYSYLVKPFRADQLHTAIQVALQRHRLEQTDQREQQQIANTLRSLGDPTITTNLQGKITFINAAAAALTGWQAHEALEQPIEQVFRLIDSETQAAIANPLQQAIQNDTLVRLSDHCLLIDRTGQTHCISDSATPIKNEQGETIGGVIVFQDISDRKHREDQLRQEAFCDLLTSLPNRRLFLDRLGQSFRTFCRTNQLFAVIFIDLDDFKTVNDTLGHLAGDQLLLEAGQRFAKCLRSLDTVARLGGDEFGFLLQAIEGQQDAERCGDRLLAQLAEPFILDQQSVQVKASIGITIADRSFQQAEDLLRAADLAMYKIKQDGGNSFQISP
ncbi:MAG: diguanylate cyclase [Aphanocapsa sp. GSE-SYN-MK-11-07L]|jgi:diguanylate cyclase (GGDEF)-like protein/PAS domain S-box-containing protein|nr:diguanylate cyclase [Aphanocapsa sp. GSE-SYN-MK-11-07L]